jgi:hypothetical protein
MFSKLKSSFGSEATQGTQPPSFPHPKLEGADISQCPFMSKRKQGEPAPPMPHTSKQEKNKKGEESDSDS